jgi:uncharacterized protein (UPF0210 family)
VRHPSRRDFLEVCGAAALLAPGLRPVRAGLVPEVLVPTFRVRTITAGIRLPSLKDPRPVQQAIARLQRGKQAFEAAGYEVQTLRITTQPFLSTLTESERDLLLHALQALDQVVAEAGIRLGIGSVYTQDRAEPALAQWAGELTNTTKQVNFTVTVASPALGVHRQGCRVAAETILSIARSTPDGIGNFRFAAAANIPAGTPFFPVGYHEGAAAIAVGLETASLIEAAASGARDAGEARSRIQARFDLELAKVERIAQAFAQRERCRYLGIDPSPAPGKDRSIGAAIEVVSGVPFGSVSTLDACAVVTGILKALRVRTCGYAGLMLPVLEDPVLARRAQEGRFGVRDLLLYSSVCGTGLDTIALPGDTAPELLAGLIGDVAALSAKWHKPLSARIFPIAGKGPGEIAHFDDPFLSDSPVFAIG